MTTPAVKSWRPTPDEERAFRSTDETFHWLCGLPPERLRQLGGKWVAAKECRVVASADTFEQLLRELGGADLGELVIDRIERPAWVVYR